MNGKVMYSVLLSIKRIGDGGSLIECLHEQAPWSMINRKSGFSRRAPE
ncbi:hypothetical protein J2Z69_000194 [Paenibacillus shirakamiensis]|uniref:Transposase n=1 Tax=Paenibacillus shirakamiensis TaxID=1265935 RepID=A0ABS4JBS9_9BACL|nr:hypothetical protein [Paenibacillus shirakamiensis]